MQSSTPPPPSPSATGPTASEGGARVSLEREPWRALRPSIAIGFSSWRRGDWSPDAPSEDFRRDAIAGIETARAIARRFTELDCALSDCLEALLRPLHRRILFAGTSERYSTLRDVAARDDRLVADRESLIALADWLTALEPKLDLLVHGFLDVREERSGRPSFRFQLGRKRATLDGHDLNTMSASLDRFATDATARLRAIRAWLEASSNEELASSQG